MRAMYVISRRSVTRLVMATDYEVNAAFRLEVGVNWKCKNDVIQVLGEMEAAVLHEGSDGREKRHSEDN